MASFVTLLFPLGIERVSVGFQLCKAPGRAWRILYRETDKDLSTLGRPDCPGSRLVPIGVEGPGSVCRDSNLESAFCHVQQA